MVTLVQKGVFIPTYPKRVILDAFVSISINYLKFKITIKIKLFSLLHSFTYLFLIYLSLTIFVALKANTGSLK